MKTRKLGRTGLDISELVFGGGWVGGILIDADDDTRRTALKRALDSGINWIDTASTYGDGKSETALGWLLKEVESPPMLSTKVRIDVDNMSNLAGQIERSLEASLERLKLDRVEVFQLHNQIVPETGDGKIGVSDVLGDGGVADIFDRLKGQGLFDHYGFTALGQTPSILEVVDSGRFDTAQVYYNMLNSSAGRDVPSAGGVQDFGNILSRMKAQDMGSFIIRVFAAGVIPTEKRTGREIMVADGTDVDVDAARAAAVFASVGTTHGTRGQTGVRYALAHPDMSGIVFGLASLDHLDEAIAASEMGPLDAQAVAAIDAAVDGGFGV